MPEEILQPSLCIESKEELKIYDISKLFNVALFGVIPTIALGNENAKFLGINKKHIKLMTILGGVILFSYLIVTSLAMTDYLKYSTTTIRWIYRVGCIVLNCGYRGIMSDKFNQHKASCGKLRPILKDSIKWIIIGIVCEIVCIFIIGSIIISIK